MKEATAKDVSGVEGVKQDEDNNSMDKLVQRACHNWLNASQIHHLLSLALLHQVPITTIPKRPQSGSLFVLSDKGQKPTKQLKGDGYEWKKKRGSNAVRKDVMKLMINKIARVEAHYYHSETIPTFKRRMYVRLEGDVVDKRIAVVHYLDAAQEFQAHRESCTCLGCWLSVPLGEIAVGGNWMTDVGLDSGGLVEDVKEEMEVEHEAKLMEHLIIDDLFVVDEPPVVQSMDAAGISGICIKDFVPSTLARTKETRMMICLCHSDASPLTHAPTESEVQIRLGENTLINGRWVIPGVVTATFPPFCGRVRQTLSLVIGGVVCKSHLVGTKAPANVAYVSYEAAAAPSPSPTPSPRNRFSSPPLPPPGVSILERLEAKRKRGETKIDRLVGGDKSQLDDMGEEELTEMSEVLLQRAVALMIQLSMREQGMANELNSLDESGYALLHYTVIYNHTRLTRVLLQHGASVNLCTFMGESPLHFAAENGNVEICSILLQHGADGNLTDAFGLTAFHIAQQKGNEECVELLGSGCHSASSGTLKDMSDPQSNLHVSWGEDLVSTHKREVIHTKLLRGALASMSLKDRCALSLVKEPREDNLGRSRSSSDVQSIVSEHEENLHAAIAAMHESERAELEEEARKIQTNFRKWMLRKNVETSCMAQTNTKKYLARSTDLETNATKVQAVGKGFLARREYSRARQDVIQLQAATRGVLVRREFQKLRNQVNSILVIQRSVRARQMRRRQGDNAESHKLLH